MNTTQNQPTPPAHYYGDIVRKLFLAAGLVMICTVPFFTDLIGVPFIISILAVMTMALLAGLQSPTKNWVTRINTIIAAIGFMLFQYKTMTYYIASTSDTISWLFFAVNQLLAILFFVALYYSSKTMRNVPVELASLFLGRQESDI